MKVYERQVSLLHAKTAVIDGVWSTAGSTNFDLWSFMRNNEINAIILGVDFANEMEELFKKDLAVAKEITPEDWSQRPIFDRMKEFFARVATPVLREQRGEQFIHLNIKSILPDVNPV